MTKHVFLEGKNLKYPPTNQRRDHLLEVFGAVRERVAVRGYLRAAPSAVWDPNA